jgi:PAS domain S-box-containing protein
MDQGLQVLWGDGERILFRGSRPGADGERKAVLAVLPAADSPPPQALERLAHEYKLGNELDDAWAVRPLEFAREDGRAMLLLEDPGGEPLARLLGQPMEIGDFLRLAISIASALRKAHQVGLVHKDIKPGNILVNCADGAVRLTGFGIATRLPRERRTLAPPETIAGTLAYMAPEQTGWMNRSIDSRSDLYSLGVVLYQMLIGALPFSASDPTEWVHCHVARKPAPPGDRVETVPAPISKIVMKLLAKAAEERYQSAAGLERDLQRCLADWERQRRIDDFPLGLNDTSDRLLIPETLYGRTREVAILLEGFERIVQGGAPELVLVSGYSGIGKSALVNELHKVLVPLRGLFASGKFDQYRRDIPYATLAQAFQGLIRPLLAKGDAELASWRDALREALGPDARLMIDVVPELKLLIGEQPPVLELPAQQAQSRLQQMFRRFLGVFARAEHPLALFLDDLQWLDTATLDVLADLLTEASAQWLLVIGAYRDNEVDSTHPLMRKLNTIRKAGAIVRDIGLAPLAQDDLGRLIAATLGCTLRHANPLARLMHQKTGGNPFFAIQFISALAEEGLLRFDHDAACWRWELNRIRAKGYTDNVLDLMVGKLTRLPVATLAALQQLACLGNIAEITMLSIVLGKPDADIRSDLWDAVRLELVEQLEGSYRFVHDRVQEAAYSLMAEDARAAAHLRIGRLLATRTPVDKREEAIFEIVNQLNRGAVLIASRDECEQLAELNLLAGKRAKATTAYVSALTYLTTGEALLPEDAWERRHELTFALALHRGECEFLTGALVQAEQRLEALSSRAASTVDRATVACLRVELYTTLDQGSRAIAVGLDYLRHLGIDWPPHPTEEEARREYDRIWSQLGSRTIESLIELPIMSDPASLATLDVLAKIGPPAFYTDANLLALVTCRAVNLSLERGNCDASCSAYVLLSMVAGPRFGDYRTAVYRFGQLGYDLVEGRGRHFQARAYMDFGNNVLPWTRHVRAGRDLVHRAFEAANKIGDLNCATSCCNQLNTNLLAAGDPLAEAEREAEHGLAFARKARYGIVIDAIAAQIGLIRTLRGLTQTFGSFDDEQFDERRIERRFSENPDLAFVECWYWVRKLQARFFAGDYASAIEASSRAQRLLWTSASQFESAEYHFYGALSQAAFSDSASPDRRRQRVEALAAHHGQLKIWAANCPENFENRVALVGAEIARIEGRDVDAMRLFEQAIHSARKNDFVHNEALAYERASAFYGARGFDQIAELYLRNARYGYLRWGADGKVRQLEALYPYLRAEEPAPSPTSTIETSVERLDLATVIKVSQTVSGEIVPERLIDTLMRTAIAQAAAERGLLIVEQRIAAEAVTSGDSFLVQLGDEPITTVALPESVLHYVVRSNEAVILDDAAAQSEFASDPYIRQRQTRSILCVPMINQGRLKGVLYLENNLTPRVFLPARVTMLKLLASQAAISLENSRLYRDLAEREAKIRRLVDANIIGIIIRAIPEQVDGPIVEANDAFLRMVGYDREDFVSGLMNWAELTPPEWRDADARAVAKIRTAGTVPVYEKEYFRKDGSRVPVLVGAASLENATYVVAFVLDLTERKAAEEAVRESEERFRTLMQFSFEIYWETDAQHRFVRLDSERLSDAPPPGSEIGKTRWELPYLEPDEETWRNHRETLDAHLPFRDFEVARPVAAGGKRYVSVSGLPVFDKAGRFTGYRGVARDITERKRGSEALREAQTQLAHANRVATMGQLTASIAHEVNQPIAATVTNAEAALRFLSARRPDLDEVREALGWIVRDGDRAGAVLGRIRALVKGAPRRNERVEINAAIREVVELTRSEATRNRVMVLTDLGDELPLVSGDRVELQQVILNLILNAIEAMSATREGSRELLITRGTNESGDLLVAVRDSGPGLAPGALENLFEAFHTTKPNGLGLGLSICRSIVEGHGGRLWASANLPRGAVFQFTLPVSQDVSAPNDVRG